MKFCPVVPEIRRGQVHGARKERRITRIKRIRIIIIIIRNGAKTISLQTLFGRLNKNINNNNKKRSKNNKSPNVVWET
jgi:hypothetical protein